MKCEMTMKMDKRSYSSLFKMGQIYILGIRNALIHYDLKKCFTEVLLWLTDGKNTILYGFLLSPS